MEYWYLKLLRIVFRAFFCAVVIVPLLVCSKSNELYYSTDGEQILLNWIAAAERHIRIFIYPIPDSNVNITEQEHLRKKTRKVFSHFLSELVFPSYLKEIQRKSSRYSNADYRKHLIVDDPAEANIFLIDHHWVTKSDLYPNCTSFFQQHLFPIINNVVDNYPYHNKSDGKNHFMMSVYDNGAFRY